MNENIIIAIIFFIMIMFGIYITLKDNPNPKLNIYGEVPRNERYIFSK